MRSGFWEARIIWKEAKWALNTCCSQKSRLRRYASENDIKEPCREIVRRPKFQGYMVPEGHYIGISALSWLLLAGVG